MEDQKKSSHVLEKILKELVSSPENWRQYPSLPPYSVRIFLSD
jgi:hypothetical protein